MKSILVCVSLLLMAGAVFAQSAGAPIPSTAPSNSLGLQGAPNPFSLLDFSRMRWSHSYSISFFSGGGSSGSVGLLNTTMDYELSKSLSLSLNVGVMHNSGALWGDGRNDATILPGFQLDYHPSEKFRLMLGFQRVSGLSPYYYNDGSWRRSIYPY